MIRNFYNGEQPIVAAQLAEAIDQNQFELYYQPKVQMRDGGISEVEALIRWNHPTLGVILPNHFIPLAEEMNLIHALGTWVIEEASRQIKRFQEKEAIKLSVAINISPLQLYDPSFDQIVRDIIYKTEIEPEQLKFEITENIMLDQAEVLPMINRIKTLGIRFSLDDFGTGYSSLMLLKEFPIDEIKIDRSFIKNILFNHKNKTIVRAMIAMAHQLSIDITAEGVETKEQLRFLYEEDCAQVQGYFFSKPVPLANLMERINRINDYLARKRVSEQFSEKQSYKRELDEIRKDLQETLREHQGMILKFKKQDDQFIHTLSDGELLYKMGFSPEDLIGRTLYDVLPAEDAAWKTSHYERAWQGYEVTFEAQLKGYNYIAKLRPIRQNGEVVEVILSADNITERIESEVRFLKIAEYTLSGVVIYTEDVILYANKAAKHILQEENLIEKSVQEIIGIEERQFLTRVEKIACHKKLGTLDLQVNIPNGQQLYLRVSIVPIKYENHEAFMVLFNDETKLRNIEQTVMKSVKELGDVNHALNESSIVAITDQRGTIQFVNEKFCEITQYEPDEVIGQNHRILNSSYHPRPFFQDMWRTIASGQVWNGEIRNITKNGSIYWVDTTIVPFLNDNGKPYQYVSIRNDITERKLAEEALRQSEEKLKYLAFHDPLTSISNRRMFMQELDALLKKASRGREKFAVAYIDMDGLKKINDAIGHEGGDIAIKKFVDHLSAVVKNRALMSRQGGDEFTLLIPNLTDEKEAIQLMEDIMERLKKAYHLVFPIRASIGLAFYPKNAKTRNQLLKLADEALYQAKKNGKNQYKVVSTDEA